MQKINLYTQVYNPYFYISKFLLTKQTNLFTIKFVKYAADVNKISLLSTFWILLLLFGQLPKLKKYNKNHLIEKIGHSFLTVTDKAKLVYQNFKKITNFFLLYANPCLITVGKKNKNKVNQFVLTENNYFPELTNLPHLQVEPFDIVVTIGYSNLNISFFEKIQILRIFQIPITIKWNVKKFNKKK